ncbi:MAG: Uma2 family endonuclease [Planctomycetota bacterium]
MSAKEKLMSVAPTPNNQLAHFSIDHYEHMVSCGAFEYGLTSKHVELLRGTLYEKYGKGPAHFSLEEYEHLVAVGAFDAPYDLRVELLHGAINMMSPIGPSHSNLVDFLTKWSFQSIANLPLRVRVQNPIRLPSVDSEPEPDICWVNEDDYSQEHPGPDDVLLIIEVAGSSLLYDRDSKLSVYASAGIKDYWIANISESRLEVYREPKGDSYQQQILLKDDEAISPSIQPSAKLAVSNLFPAK